MCSYILYTGAFCIIQKVFLLMKGLQSLCHITEKPAGIINYILNAFFMQFPFTRSLQSNLILKLATSDFQIIHDMKLKHIMLFEDLDAAL